MRTHVLIIGRSAQAGWSMAQAQLRVRFGRPLPRRGDGGRRSATLAPRRRRATERHGCSRSVDRADQSGWPPDEAFRGNERRRDGSLRRLEGSITGVRSRPRSPGTGPSTRCGGIASVDRPSSAVAELRTGREPATTATDHRRSGKRAFLDAPARTWHATCLAAETCRRRAAQGSSGQEARVDSLERKLSAAASHASGRGLFSYKVSLLTGPVE
jgi:hypothetical protein